MKTTGLFCSCMFLFSSVQAMHHGLPPRHPEKRPLVGPDGLASPSDSPKTTASDCGARPDKPVGRQRTSSSDGEEPFALEPGCSDLLERVKCIQAHTFVPVATTSHACDFLSKIVRYKTASCYFRADQYEADSTPPAHNPVYEGYAYIDSVLDAHNKPLYRLFRLIRPKKYGDMRCCIHTPHWLEDGGLISKSGEPVLWMRYVSGAELEHVRGICTSWEGQFETLNPAEHDALFAQKPIF